METTVNPLIISVFLATFAAIVAGVYFLFRLLLGSYTSPASLVLIGYLVGFMVYCGSLYIGAQLNPRDMVGGSWSDPYLRAATCLGFLLCVALPFRLRIPWVGRIAVAAANIVILAVPFWLWFSATA